MPLDRLALNPKPEPGVLSGPGDMELQRDLFREAFLAANKRSGNLQEALRTSQIECRRLAAKLEDSQDAEIRLLVRRRSTGQLLWVYGIWASAVTVALAWMVAR